ncbi:MBL fold metallo-hydrolase [Parapedobacter sp. SGR-10]|uniref:MBL fold metallo-hydrolase n=1 Tax=Parapedobacter sp. SGR-10 TaxID=2710879 RepID=UPI00197CEF7E|nr:MBL fold metallo-hydrolase [Parapedobacter sp. SGR-10]
MNKGKNPIALSAKKRKWVFLFCGSLSLIYLYTAMKPTDANIRFISNPELGCILPNSQWKGNRIDEKGRFSNLNHPYTPTYSSILKMMSEKNPQRNAKKNDTFQLPFIEDLSFLDNKEDVVIWLGHATFFIRINGISLITDPVFANVSVSERKSKLPFSPDLLRNLDYVLISHDHRDHLDKKSLLLIIENNPTAEILSGLRMDEWFNKMLVSPKTQLAGWYQQYHTDTSKVKIYFLPARHWSSRNLTDANQHLWGSFIIQDNENTLYFSGDTGYDSHLKEVATLFGEIDICMMGIGAYKPEWFMSPNHISPLDAIKAVNEMQVKNFIPMHYGTFDLSDEPIGEPIELIKQEELKGTLKPNLIDLKVGENYYF